MLLKSVLLAYRQGTVSGRAMEAACREDVLCMAVSGDSQPHFTPLAEFIRPLGEAVARVFTQVLAVCDRQGLMGRELFARDGVKLPGNASKAESGTRRGLEREALEMEAAAARILQRHRDDDTQAVEPGPAVREQRQLERLGEEARKLRRWLDEPPEERRGPKGSLRQRGRTDNEAAKVAAGEGVIQGYTAVAAVDERHQISREAQARGVGQGQELLVPVIEALPPQLAPGRVITADAGHHSAAHRAALERLGLDAYIPGVGYRKRDPRCAAPQRHRDTPDPLYAKTPKPAKPRPCSAQAFRPAGDLSHGLGPAGKRR